MTHRTLIGRLAGSMLSFSFSATLLSASLAACLAAQEVERPVAFDSAGRIMTVTPALANRLRLTAPLWPVSGTYVEARLLQRANDSFVISVQQNDGSVSRFPITGVQRSDLGRAMTVSMAAERLSTGERLDIISAPAGGQFVRNQAVAGLLLYGPLMASFPENGSTATAVYLLTAGASFFTAAAISRSGSITRAQNHLATDGVWRGALFSNALRYVVNEDNGTDNSNALITLGGSLIGSTLGFQLGRKLTDGEANAATFGSTMAIGLTAGTIGVLGGFTGESQRPEVAALLGATLVGYPLGLRYVHRASYNVTAGDVSTLETSAFLGVLGGGAMIAGGDPSGRAIAGFLTAGLLAGATLGDRLLVKPYDFTESQGWLVRLGAVAGGLISLAVPFALKSEEPAAYLGAATLGAAVGMGVTTRMITPNVSRQP